MRKECDVLVVGAGVSGIPAAITAARKNMRVILVEKEDFLGGSAVVGMHRVICGLYVNSKDFPREPLNVGIIREICGNLRYKQILRIGKVYVLSFKIRELTDVFQSLINREDNLEILYKSEVVSLTKKNNRVISVYTTSDEIIPRTVIDCSGEGIILKLSDSYQKRELPQARQLSGYTFKIGGLRGCDDTMNIKVPYLIGRAIKREHLPEYLKIATFSMSETKDEGYCRFNIPKDMAKENVLSNDAVKVHKYLSGVLPVFKKSFIAEKSLGVLDREGIRLDGEYILTVSDVLNNRKFKDPAIKNAWPIELWEENKGPRYQYLEQGEYYEIPQRSLKARAVLNLYAAGRCISVSRQALGSTRVMGACICLGEAAAYLASKDINENLIS